MCIQGGNVEGMPYDQRGEGDVSYPVREISPKRNENKTSIQGKYTFRLHLRSQTCTPATFPYT